jgi:hypothetical protein
VAPEDWHSHHLVHLGSGRFCTARFYRDDDRKRFAVFTGVEVDRGLSLVKDKSLRYNLDDDRGLNLSSAMGRSVQAQGVRRSRGP